MPLQVIERQPLDTSGAANAVQNMQAAVNAKRDAENKAFMMKYYAAELKNQMKQTDNEVEKTKLQQKIADMEFGAKLLSEAGKSPNPSNVMKLGISMFPDWMERVGKDKDFQARIDSMQPSGEEQLNSATANLIRQKMGMGDPANNQAGWNAQGIQPNRAGAVSGGLVMPKIPLPGGGELVDLADTAAVKRAETLASEGAKPYNETEAGVMSKVDNMPAIADELINLIGDTSDKTKDIGIESSKHVYDNPGVPFGASRISAFGESGPWQAIKRGITAGRGRKAGLLLQGLKLMLFGEGGKQLTEGERQVAGALLSPAYKTEDEWVSDLKKFKKMLLDKGAYMRKGGNPINPIQSGDATSPSDDAWQTLQEMRRNAGGR